MINWVAEHQQPERVMMITECSMADNVAAENPTPSSSAPATCART
jgi:hypothetical protein